MELAGNFIAALATVHDLPSSREMLEYTYGLFLARFPNLSTRDGGWAEGFSYFGVNESCIVDMALLMKRVGGLMSSSSNGIGRWPSTSCTLRPSVDVSMALAMPTTALATAIRARR